MKAAQALIAWNPATGDYRAEAAPPGAIGVGPLYSEHDGNGDWAGLYRCTGGAAYTDRRKLFGVSQQLAVMKEWYMLVYSYGIDPYLAHLAFLMIDEYQAVIKGMGFGPAKGEHGFDPQIGFGRAIATEQPRVRIRHRGEVSHFWPERILEVAA
jgi:hypothetical protein